MKSKTKSASLKRLALIVMSIVSALFFAHAIFGERGYLALREARERSEDLKSRIQELEAQNKQLIEEVKALKTDPRTIERIAREELGLVKPGDIKITTSEPSLPASSEPAASNGGSPKPSAPAGAK